MNNFIYPVVYILSLFANYDNRKAESYIKQADNYSDQFKFKKSDSLLFLANEIYSKNNYTLKVGIIYNRLGLNKYNARDYKNAMEYFRKALIYKMSDGNEVEIAKSSLNIANVYYEMGGYEIALKYYSKANIIFKKYQDYNDICEAQINIGKCYVSLMKYETAEKNLDTAISLTEIYRKEYILNVYLIKICLKLEQNKFNDALTLCNYASQFIKDSNDKIYIVNNKLNIFNRTNNFDSTKFLIMQNDQYINNNNNEIEKSVYFSNKAETLIKTNEEKKAIDLLNQCIVFFKNQMIFNRVVECYQLLNTCQSLSINEKLVNNNMIKDALLNISKLDKNNIEVIMSSNYAFEKDLLAINFENKILKFTISFLILLIILSSIILYLRFKYVKKLKLKDKSLSNNMENFQLIQSIIEKDITNIWTKLIFEYFYKKSQIKEQTDFSLLDSTMDTLIKKIDLIKTLVKS